MNKVKVSLPTNIDKIIDQMRYEARDILGFYPNAFKYLLQLKPDKKDLLVCNSTDIVIEGFPRSANTFAYVAFDTAQKKPLRIAHHLHIPAQIILGVKYKKPVLVLVRDPKDAVASLIIRRDTLSINQALRSYIRFYRNIWHYQNSFFVAPFDEVINTFDVIIKGVNEKFDVHFEVFSPSEENIKHVFNKIDELDKLDQGYKEADETTVARPSTNRMTSKENIMKIFDEFERSKKAEILNKAQAIYNEYLEVAKHQKRNYKLR